MAKKRKPGARQRRILEKYKHIVESLNKKPSLFSRGKVSRAYRKVVSGSAEIKKIKARLAVETDPRKAFKLRESLFKKTMKFTDVKTSYYEVKAQKTISDKGLVKYPGDDNVTEAEAKAMEDAKERLTNYKYGDETVTKFFHEYGFDTINNDTLYAFIKGEGFA